MPFTEGLPPLIEPSGSSRRKHGKTPNVETARDQVGRNVRAAATIGLVVLLAAGAGYELADALRAIPTGSAPGEGPTGSGFFVGMPAFGLLLGGFGCIYLARRGARPPLAWLVAPLAGAFILAHFYSYDEYCGGYGCRVSDEAPTADHWVFALVAAGLLAGTATQLRPRVGLRLTAAVAIVCALTVFFVPFGH
jgi:hypothetical protein